MIKFAIDAQYYYVINPTLRCFQMKMEISNICDFKMTLNISSGVITQQMKGVFIRHSSVAVSPPSEFTLLPQLTNDKHLWTVAAICWVFQSILS